MGFLGSQNVGAQKGSWDGKGSLRGLGRLQGFGLKVLGFPGYGFRVSFRISGCSAFRCLGSIKIKD